MKPPTKAELQSRIETLEAKIKLLENDLITYSSGLIELEDKFESFLKLFSESSNPYNNNGPDRKKLWVDITIKQRG